MLGSWALYDKLESPGEWWTLFFVALTVVVIYPAQIAWQRHNLQVKRTSEETLCSTCKHYLTDNTLCSVLDEHVEIDGHPPCEGMSWEPLPVSEVELR